MKILEINNIEEGEEGVELLLHNLIVNVVHDGSKARELLKTLRTDSLI